MKQLRALEPDDIPRIVALRRRVFSHSLQSSDAALALYYRTLFFENPWYDDRYPCWVQEACDGEMVGFVGAIPRPMLLGGERLTAITTTELMVAPEARGLVGPKLLRRLFDGAQHITYSDRSTHQARALYEGLGGSTALWYSLYWSMTLDGSRISFESAPAAKTRNVAARVLTHASRWLDRLSKSPLTRTSVSTHDEPLAPDTVVGLMRRLAGQNTLSPEYEGHTFEWLLKRLSDRQDSGRVVTRQVLHAGQTIGWFVYVVQADRDVDVVQLGALPGRERLVFDHLVHHASMEGGLVLLGRLDRRFAPLISERRLPLTLGQPWSVVRSDRQDVTAQFLTGNAFFSRLDAEWWIRT